MTTPTVPVVAGLFDVQGGQPALLGTQCGQCSTSFFPPRARCTNPACEGAVTTGVRLSNHGTLYSWSVQAYRPPALFGMEPWAPYAIVLVDLPEGVRVMGMLTGATADALRFGMPMALKLEALRIDAEGREVLTWKFAPVNLVESAA